MTGPGRGSEEEVVCRACKVEEIEECPSKFDKDKDISCTRAATPTLLLCCLAGVLIRVETQT